MPDLKPLWEVQLLDGQKKALELELKEGKLAKELKLLKHEFEQERSVFKNLKEQYNSLKKKLKTKELDAAAAAEQVKNLRHKLYSGAITNVREIKTSNHKLDNLQDIVNKTEDDMLGLMEELDSLRSQLEIKSELLNKKADEYRQLHGTYLAKQQKIKSVLAQLPATREKILEKVEPWLWTRYVEMKKNFDDPLSRVEKGICLGCRMSIPFNQLRLLKQGTELVYCSNCGRLLLWER